MKKKTKLTAIFLILLIACAAVWLTASDNTENTLYRTATVTRGNIAEVVTANGTLNPLELVSVGTQVSGQISQLYVKLNDEVKKGQLLAEIDPSLLESQLKQTKASLETSRTAFELAGRDLERTRMLVAKDYVARTDLERAEQSYQAAKNSYESAKSAVDKDMVNLGYTKITSPIDGVIISQEVTMGQTMAANFQTPNLFKIAGDLKQMKIDVNFSEADISKVKAGLPVSFTVDAFPDKEFTGKVETVNLNPNNQSGVVTYSVTVAVENPEKLLLPGMTAFVRVILSERKDVLRVPAAALRFAPPKESVSGLSRLFNMGMRQRGGRNYNNVSDEQSIYLLKNDALVPVAVKTGSTDETYIEISGEGVSEGDTVVVGLAPAKKR